MSGTYTWPDVPGAGDCSPSIERFNTKFQRCGPADCWPWIGALDHGYGRFSCDGRIHMAHRIAYELTNGPIPLGLHIDHLCRNRACVNPRHLEPVTIATNVLRGHGISAANAAKTECLRGHPLDQTNTYLRVNGARACRTCQRQRLRDWRTRKTAA